MLAEDLVFLVCPMTRIDPTVFDMIERVRNEQGYTKLRRAAKTAKWCARPIQLSQSPERVGVRRKLGCADHPRGSDFDEIYFKACGTRRLSRCQPCSKVYQGDARQLILAGLVGGKGISVDVSKHPTVFATLTAPSFGQVHRAIRKSGGKSICHPYGNKRCKHGKTLSCYESHFETEEILGAPLCSQCYRYKKAVIWNAGSTKLWQRTTIYLRRQLARLLGLGEKEFSKQIRVSYAKVIEYQRRGVIHLHVVIRLDDSQDRSSPPGLNVRPSQIELALRLAVGQVRVAFEFGDKIESIAWGTELDVKEIDENMVGKIANYIAKYATKSSCDSGSLNHQFKSEHEIRASGAPEHVRKMALTAWELGHNAAYGDLNLAMWAHDLGHRGHFLTKSRQYSVTFSYLRQLRQIWQDEHSKENGEVVDVKFEDGKSWHFVGRGWPFPCDSFLVAQEALDRDEARELMKEQLEKEMRSEVSTQ